MRFLLQVLLSLFQTFWYKKLLHKKSIFILWWRIIPYIPSILDFLEGFPMFLFVLYTPFAVPTFLRHGTTAPERTITLSWWHIVLTLSHKVKKYYCYMAKKKCAYIHPERILWGSVHRPLSLFYALYLRLYNKLNWWWWWRRCAAGEWRKCCIKVAVVTERVQSPSNLHLVRLTLHS